MYQVSTFWNSCDVDSTFLRYKVLRFSKLSSLVTGVLFAPTIGPSRDFPLPKPRSQFEIHTWLTSPVIVFSQVILDDAGERDVLSQRSKDAEYTAVSVRIPARSIRHELRVFRNLSFLGER